MPFSLWLKPLLRTFVRKYAEGKESGGWLCMRVDHVKRVLSAFSFCVSAGDRERERGRERERERPGVPIMAGTKVYTLQDIEVQLRKGEFHFYSIHMQHMLGRNCDDSGSAKYDLCLPEVDFLWTLLFKILKLYSLILPNPSICDICLGEIMCSSSQEKKGISNMQHFYIHFPVKVPVQKQES